MGEKAKNLNMWSNMNLSFPQKRIMANAGKILAIALVFIILEYFALRRAIGDMLAGKWNNPEFIAAIGWFALGVFFAWVLSRIEHRLKSFLDPVVQELKIAIKGNRGEKIVFEKLNQILDPLHYRIFTNFKIPGTRFDNDIIVVGPKGVISIEVKNISGTYGFEGEDTYRYDWHFGNECIDKLREYKSPTKQLMRHAQALKNWMEENGLSGIVPRRALVLAGEGCRVNKMENKSVYVVLGAEKLADYFQSCYEDPRFTSEFCEKVIKLFESNK